MTDAFQRPCGLWGLFYTMIWTGPKAGEEDILFQRP